MSAWSKFYQDRVGNSYTEYAAVRYAPMIQELMYCGGRRYLEQGCGIGTITKCLVRAIGVNNAVHKNMHFHLTDKDRDILRLAGENLKESYRDCMTLRKENIFSPYPGAPVDVVFSHGVLEHFCDEAIKAILKHQRNMSGTVIHYVPTNGYNKPSFGDERLLPKMWWLNKWNPSEFKTFNDGKDLLLIWR